MGRHDAVIQMVSILSPKLAAALVVLAIVAPVAFGVYRGLRSKGRWWSRVLRGAAGWFVLLVCQVVGLAAVFLQVNQSYGLFTSWSQLVGVPSSPPRHDLVKIRGFDVRKIKISKNNPHPGGMWSGITMEGTDPRYSHLPVWLPPQYFEKSQAHTSFPVLYWVGGVNDTGEHANVTVPLTGPSQTLIRAGQINPFAIVFLPGRIREGQDSECTNIGGIDHQSWILDNVIPKVEERYRLGHRRAARFIAGYSTGGYCAANLTSKYPERFNAGFGLAPYFHPLFDPPQSRQATRRLIDDNSVLLRLKEGQVPKDVRYLTVVSTADKQAWNDPSSHGEIDGEAFWKLARKSPQYAFMLLKQGGHYTGTYTPCVEESLRWLGQYGL